MVAWLHAGYFYFRSDRFVGLTTATELTRFDRIPKFALSGVAIRVRPDTLFPLPFKGFDNHDPHWREEIEQWATPLGS